MSLCNDTANIVSGSPLEHEDKVSSTCNSCFFPNAVIVRVI